MVHSVVSAMLKISMRSSNPKEEGANWGDQIWISPQKTQTSPYFSALSQCIVSFSETNTKETDVSRTFA